MHCDLSSLYILLGISEHIRTTHRTYSQEMPRNSSETDAFKAHYHQLREYLTDYLVQIGYSHHRGRSSAKEKLSRLPAEEFIKVSTDVHDEIMRRMYDAREVPFLPVRPDLLPKRNQARQKMATLSLPRFQELACEVLFEIEKRFSWLPDEYEQNSRNTGRGTAGSSSNGPRSPPSAQPSPSSSNAAPIIPSRGGRFSNSQSSSAGGSGRESSLRQLQQQQQAPSQLQTSHSIGNKSPRHHADTSNNSSMVSPDEIDRIRADYEFKLAKMEQQLRDSSVEDQLIDLENQLSEQKKNYGNLETKYNQLKREHEGLQDDYNQQQKIADSLRAEASNLLSEVKTLTTKNQDLQEQLSKATAAASSSSFQKRPSESYNSPMPTRIETPTKSTLPETPETLDKKLDVYYDSIDKLALAARGDQPTAVLISMKSVLLACKAITQECEALEQAGVLNDSDRTRLKSGKESLSNCLGHLMALAKDHASGTMSSGSLNTAIDRLTQSLNDLTYIMKRYENGNSDPRTRVNSWATPPESPKAQMSTRSMMNIVELKMFLEEQTDDIAHTIQDLLQTMRSPSSSGPELKHFIRKINDRIDVVVEESRLTFSKHGDSELVMDANDLTDTLSRTRSTMDGLADDIMADSSSKSVKQKIANTSYEIAKSVKELLGLLE